MLNKFSVSNFKGFKDTITFDLTAKDYEFNPNIIKNGVVNKAIIYGKNGVGKSNLGKAIFDIIYHLTDNKKLDNNLPETYFNLESKQKVASFKYTFKFDNDIVQYEYQRKALGVLLNETLYFNDEKIIDVNYDRYQDKYINDQYINASFNANIDLNGLSLIKYIYRNTDLSKLDLLSKMMNYVNNMLWFRSLSDGNSFAGFSNIQGAFLADCLAQYNAVQEFQKFLETYDLHYHLRLKETNGVNTLMTQFTNEEGKTEEVPFEAVASTGTKAIYLFFVWKKLAFEQKVSLVFIDEFDAFLHYEAAESLVSGLNKLGGFQTILTSHNTYLMNNKITRPDSCYIITDNRIKALTDCTDKEIREAHNLEKMYRNGAFVNE
ncbi:MAG: AAA family ATPase [Elusimicrobiaceae bacterium]|nr:AAA family ATPase [Elusimicrobiaceae bacterium]